MPKIITVARHLIPTEHLAYAEPFDPNANPEFHPSRDFKTRVVLINRNSLLTEEPLPVFAESNGFRMLVLDGLAINPAIPFRVETFAPTSAFTPTKPYATRLIWHDTGGNEHSKLLLTDAQTVLSVAVIGDAKSVRPRVTEP